MASFKYIDAARKTLGLGEAATLEEIKDAYRQLALQFHPDRCAVEKKKECAEKFRKISDAHEVLMNYCAGYRYSFAEKDVMKCASLDDLYDRMRQLYDGWFWDVDA